MKPKVAFAAVALASILALAQTPERERESRVEVAHAEITVAPDRATLSVGKANVTIADPAANAGLTVGATIIESEHERRILLGDLGRQYDRLVVSTRALEVTVAGSIKDRLLIEAPLPDDLAGALREGDRVEVFAFLWGCHDYEHRPLGATWQSTTRTISAEVSDTAFSNPEAECDEEAAASSTSIRKALFKFAIVKRKQPIRVEK